MVHKLLLVFALLAGSATAQSRVYELRTYTCNEGKLEALKTRFRDHTIRLFARHNIETIGFWVPQDPEKSRNTLVYLLVHSSREAADKNWAEFRADPEWVKAKADSETAGPLTQKVESVFLSPTDFSKLK